MLSNRDEDGQEHPVAFASHTFRAAEKNHSQLEDLPSSLKSSDSTSLSSVVISSSCPTTNLCNTFLRKQVPHPLWHQHEYSAGLSYWEDMTTPSNTNLEINKLMLIPLVDFPSLNHLRMSQCHRKQCISWKPSIHLQLYQHRSNSGPERIHFSPRSWIYSSEEDSMIKMLLSPLTTSVGTGSQYTMGAYFEEIVSLFLLQRDEHQ